MISIILITHNRVEFLRKTINSIYREQKLNFELFVCDNNSTDGTKEYLKSLNYSNIKIIHNDKNIGQNAYNRAIKESQGELIVEIDDDILDLQENWLNTMVEAYKKIPNIGYLATDVIQDQYTNGAKPDKKYYKTYKYGQFIFEEGPAGGWCTLFSRDIYNLVGGFSEYNELVFYGEDGEFSQKVRDKGYRAGILRNVKAYHATGPVLNENYKSIFEKKMQNHDKYLNIVNENKLTNNEFILSIIIVNWQVKEYLRKCLISINKYYSRSDNIEIIVIDNASTDGSIDMIRKEFPWVRIIANLKNYGFAKANNQGIKVARGQYVLFLNPDTELKEDSFTFMINYMENDTKVGALGCRLVYPDGKLQESVRKFPTIDVALWQHHGDFLLKSSKNIIDEYYMKNMDYDILQEVDQPMGAVLMARKKALVDIGLFMDERFFMFFDEVDLCYRLKEKGWKIIYYPKTTIVHHQAKSVFEACKVGMLIDQEFHKSMFKFLWKHYYRKFYKILFVYMLYIYNKIFKIPAKTL